jgi:hypothetical protein
VSCQDRPVVIRQFSSKLFDFSDRGHEAIIVGSHGEASEQMGPLGVGLEF